VDAARGLAQLACWSDRLRDHGRVAGRDHPPRRQARRNESASGGNTLAVPMLDGLAFSYRSTRSRSITTAFCAVVVIESVAVHFAVAARHPIVAWTPTLTGLAAVLWLVRDYRAL